MKTPKLTEAQVRRCSDKVDCLLSNNYNKNVYLTRSCGQLWFYYLISYVPDLEYMLPGCDRKYFIDRLRVCRCSAFPYPHTWGLSERCQKPKTKYVGVVYTDVVPKQGETYGRNG